MQTGNYITVTDKHIEILHPVDNEHQSGGLSAAKPDDVPTSGASCPAARNRSAYSSRQNMTSPHTSIHSKNNCLQALITFPSARVVLRAFRECGLLKMPGTGFPYDDFLLRMRNQNSNPTRYQAIFSGRHRVID